MQRDITDWSARAQRKAISRIGTARLSDGREVRVLVRNISYEGCELLSDADLMVGETLLLTLAGSGSCEAQIRWIADDRSGVCFLAGQSPVELRRARIGV